MELYPVGHHIQNGLASPTGLAKARCIDIPYPYPMVPVGLMASFLFKLFSCIYFSRVELML